MLKGIYSAAAGMTSQMILTDTIADNLANISTPGYKLSTVQFKTFGEALIERVGMNQQKPMGNYAQGSQVLRSVIAYQQGDLTQTGNALDLGLQGNGFFTLKVPYKNNTIAYTRAGHFTRNNEGMLCTTDGSLVQGQNGDILIPREAQSIIVSPEGDVPVDGKTIDKLKVSQFQDLTQLRRIGSSMYITPGEPLAQAEDVTIQQGYLESSNANVITEMVNSITGLRIYELLQKSVQMQNETLGKAVNEVGRIPL